MQLDNNSAKPIFLQLKEMVEDAILRGIYAEEAQIPSTTEVSSGYRINPATVAKGYNLLVDEGIIYKKRGVGMFVKQGAVELLRERRRAAFFGEYVESMLREAQRLGISRGEIVDMIERVVSRDDG